MDLNFLDFEQPIAELEAKIAELRRVEAANDIDISSALDELEAKSQTLTEEIFKELSDRQISQLSRHPGRPYTQDYIDLIFTDYHELHGDRAYADDKAIICGLAKLYDQAVVIIGHQKGRDTKEKIIRNFGMPRPEGYRKALRVMKMAERFHLPVISLIDTPGAYPGIGAEERGQSEAIARNLFEMAKLETPIICTVIGEGGSGGALAIGVGDRLIMMEFSTYSVISPEGCASILWKSADKAKLAAEAMGITSDRIREQGFLDEVVREPIGGAHRNHEATAESLKETLYRHIKDLKHEKLDSLLEKRYQRIMSFGAFTEDVK
ncbi:MAG: acetyl-CoA carboxylase carboxyl transferase subunit alpha [Gammaproteobacteria bacterium]|nr:acetyl-CoA carboxylase carboxyl transferase subunit alpha [Gammaproteobacteria bacterium]MBT5826005.1 acetyl-CoA carboxylase carboxyl transferase subunit alpha [Gammaproteobacteria bacterium]MBT5966677.1 acetyl-CoA carboxylase carboxyl transferase subunit alpha [Gammaproteobacteria bacterium]MBT6419131.1 acetyl-CoA carboxylase carboxyl transferase subunit alpha [Gammaproteobacteria bacterium]MBT6575402.1 acetyl-CoA carboxylase carboxyl transferase subunit alpha [Gammaproteobacteria bacterium